MANTNYSADPSLIRAMLAAGGPCLDWMHDHEEIPTFIGGGVMLSQAFVFGEQNEMMGQSTIIDGIEAVAKENGATILLQTAAEALVVDEDGRVVGVKASDADGKDVYLGGAKGVILTAGGFGMNIDML